MIVQEQDFSFGDKDDAFQLRCGKALSRVNVRYETYGTLSNKKDNAILVCHALTGSAHAAGRHSEDDKKPGWWDEMIGPGKAFDTDKHFIVCSNIISSCYGTTGPRSKDPDTQELYNKDFPMTTIYDMVKVQERLMRHLEIEKWLAVAGGSLGGMQAMQWSVTFPDKVHSCIPIATCAKSSPLSIGFNWVGRQSILTDENFCEGNYVTGEPPEKGLSIARMIAHMTYLSDASMQNKFGRRLQEMDTINYEFSRNFQVESYLNYQGKQFVNRFDANSYLYITRAMDYFNLADEAGGEGSLAKALSKSQCPFCIVSFSSDWLFPPYQSVEIVEALAENQREATYCNIQSDDGHDAFLLEFETLGAIVRNFLAQQEETFHHA